MLLVPLTLALAMSATPAPAPVAKDVAFQQKMMKRPWIEPAPPPPPTISEDDDTPPVAGGAGDESVLKNVKIPTSDDALIDFFKKRTPPTADGDKLDALVKDLNDKDE